MLQLSFGSSYPKMETISIGVEHGLHSLLSWHDDSRRIRFDFNNDLQRTSAFGVQDANPQETTNTYDDDDSLSDGSLPPLAIHEDVASGWSVELSRGQVNPQDGLLSSTLGEMFHSPPQHPSSSFLFGERAENHVRRHRVTFSVRQRAISVFLESSTNQHAFTGRGTLDVTSQATLINDGTNHSGSPARSLFE